jgi:hypothetical protein
MTPVEEKRNYQRVEFSRGIDMQIVAIDGTWSRHCKLMDASDSGAKILVEGSVAGINLKEFFLVLATTGTAYRRCRLAWVNGEQIGVSFLGRLKKKTSTQNGKAAD